MEENTKWHALFLVNKGKRTKTSSFISDFWSYMDGTIVICVYLDKRKQGWLCMYIVTLRCVHAAIVAVEKQWVLHNLSVCFCSLRHPACNVCAPYCHLWPGPLYIIFPHCLIHGTVIEKTVTEHKMWVLIFFTTFVWNISHSKKKWVRYNKICISVFMYHLFLSNFKWNMNFRDRFSKYPQNTKFHKNLSTGSQVVPCWQTDMTKLIVALHTFANVPKKYRKKVIFDVSWMYMNSFFLYSENMTKKIHWRSQINSIVIMDVGMNVSLKEAKIFFFWQCKGMRREFKTCVCGVKTHNEKEERMHWQDMLM